MEFLSEIERDHPYVIWAFDQNKIYYVGAYKHESEAQVVQSQLQDAGYPAKVMRSNEGIDIAQFMTMPEFSEDLSDKQRLINYWRAEVAIMNSQSHRFMLDLADQIADLLAKSPDLQNEIYNEVDPELSSQIREAYNFLYPPTNLKKKSKK